jgi:hypothetical protein
VVLHGCETWSLTLREEHRLRVFENRVLRRIFGENCITRSFVICNLRRYNLNNQVEEDKMGGSFSKNEGEEERV